jgi:thioredoxin-like negative regulator of GroEL
MKSSTMANMQRHGKLRQVAYAVVNTDHDQTLASQLMQGSSIPQLVLFRRTDRGWQRSRLIGAQSEQQIESFIGHTPTLEVRHPVNASAAIGAE